MYGGMGALVRQFAFSLLSTAFSHPSLVLLASEPPSARSAPARRPPPSSGGTCTFCQTPYPLSAASMSGLPWIGAQRQASLSLHSPAEDPLLRLEGGRPPGSPQHWSQGPEHGEQRWQGEGLQCPYGQGTAFPGQSP